MPTKVRARMCRVAKLRIGDEVELDRGQWYLVSKIADHVGGTMLHITFKRGSKEIELPMFGTRAVRIIRR